MTIDDWRLGIDGWGTGAAAIRGRAIGRTCFQFPISNLQSPIYVCLVLLAAGLARADTPRELIEQGNEHFETGRYAEALEAYAQVGDEADKRIRAEVLHNRAAAHFKLGQFDDARELWVRAASLRDAAFEARARYNLGNCDYADALATVQAQDAQAALKLLDRATAQYRDALRLDPSLLDARANLELAAQLKTQIEELAQKQPQTQPSPEHEQNQQDQSTSQPTSQPASQPSSQPSESQQQDQRTREQDTEQQAEQAPEEQPPATQPASQPAPETQPAEQLHPEPSSAEEEEQQPAVPIEMTKEEAERLLQLIRDAERQRRATLRAREAARYRPVDKDW